MRRRHLARTSARFAEREGGFVRRRFGLRHARGSDPKPGIEVLPDGTLTDRIRPRRHSRAINGLCAETLFAQKARASASTPAAGAANGIVAAAAPASGTVMAPATGSQSRRSPPPQPSPHMAN
jgi:hypothetical protein